MRLSFAMGQGEAARGAMAVVLFALCSVPVIAAEPPYGIETRAPNTTLLIDTLPPPANLSDMPGLLAAASGAELTDQGILPYAPISKLWSDGALKERFLALPGLATVGFTEVGALAWPDGTVIVKNFLLPQDFRDPEATAKRVETRLLIKKDGAWGGYSYEWNEGETDGTLLSGSVSRSFTLTDDAGTTFSYDYYYPSRGECSRCHTPVAGFILGPRGVQLNSDYTYPGSGVTDNQLRTLEHLGVFDTPLPAPPHLLASLVDPLAPTASLRRRARSYLDINCAICHQPGGPTPAMWDGRWQTPDDEMSAIDVDPTRGDFGIPGAKIIAPGDPAASIMHERMGTLASHRMPPLATSVVDVEGLAVIDAWIESLVPPAPTTPVWLMQ